MDSVSVPEMEVGFVLDLPWDRNGPIHLDAVGLIAAAKEIRPSWMEEVLFPGTTLG